MGSERGFGIVFCCFFLLVALWPVLHGTGPRLWALAIAAGFLAHIDIERAPTVGHIWRFAGLDPTQKWEKKTKRPWNADLKTLCWKLGESFVKVKGNENDIYGKVYEARKAQEVLRNEAGELADQAADVLKNKRIGKQKSMALRELAPLAGIPGLRFIDLQYGDTAEERTRFEEETGTAIIDDEDVDQMADLDAFAAQVAAMDLVISVSNTTVHLAGALGVPAWVMLNTVPLPFWLLEGEDSPWYPSARLFRQSQAGEWADVIGRIGEALADLAGRRKT